MRAFVKAVLLGSIAAAALPTLFTLGLAASSLGAGTDDSTLFSLIYLIALPLIVTIPMVLTASIAFGLPTAAYLKRNRRESASAYTIIGAMIGLLIPILTFFILHAPAGYWTAIFGAIGGGVTAYTWWRSARAPQAIDL